MFMHKHMERLYNVTYNYSSKTFFPQQCSSREQYLQTVSSCLWRAVSFLLCQLSSLPRCTGSPVQ
uniref:Uncharacterized protein n=1 Tax=Anguilla anguilla TaxID=7936 RepID=A0A0E9QXY0_ANGAN